MSHLLVVRQVGAIEIARDEALDLLAPEQARMPRQDLLITPEHGENLALLDWGSEMRAQAATLREVRRQLPGKPTHVLYLGTTWIPLAFHLGSELTSWPTHLIHQRDHNTGRWSQRRDTSSSKITIEGLPEQDVHADGDAIVRISASGLVASKSVQGLVPKPLANVHVQVDPATPDHLNATDLDRLADEFARVIQTLASRLPNLQCIHLFIYAEVGTAFKLGTKYAPATQHPPIVLYKFLPQQGGYRRVARLPLDTPSQRGSLDVQLAARVRARAMHALTTLQQFTARGNEFRGEWTAVLPLHETDLPQLPSYIEALPRLDATNITRHSISPGQDANGEFTFDSRSRAWVFDDQLLHAIGRGFPNLQELDTALRMVLLHEEVHRTAQRLTSATSRGIGRRFPRVLEEIDYAADLWTIVHELGRAMRTQEITHANALPHLRTLVDLHLAMLQAFDAESIPFQDVQVRRVTRYLIWYWQSVALEEVTSINEALHHLTTKPVLELAGVTRFLRGGRVWMDLEAHPNLTELGLLHGARFQVFPHSETVPVADILRGIRLSDDALVRGAIRSVQDMLR